MRECACVFARTGLCVCMRVRACACVCFVYLQYPMPPTSTSRNIPHLKFMTGKWTKQKRKISFGIIPKLKIETLDKENITVYKLRDISFKICFTFTLTCIFELVFPYKSLLVFPLLGNITT